MSAGAVLFAIATLIGILTPVIGEVGNYNARKAIDADTKALKKLQRAVTEGTADIDYIRMNLNNIRVSLQSYAHILSPATFQKINRQLDRAEYATINYRNQLQDQMNSNTAGNYTGGLQDILTNHKGNSDRIDKATEKVEHSTDYLRKELADLGINDKVNIGQMETVNKSKQSYNDQRRIN